MQLTGCYYPIAYLLFSLFSFINGASRIILILFSTCKCVQPCGLLSCILICCFLSYSTNPSLVIHVFVLHVCVCVCVCARVRACMHVFVHDEMSVFLCLCEHS